MIEWRWFFVMIFGVYVSRNGHWNPKNHRLAGLAGQISLHIIFQQWPWHDDNTEMNCFLCLSVVLLYYGYVLYKNVFHSFIGLCIWLYLQYVEWTNASCSFYFDWFFDFKFNIIVYIKFWWCVMYMWWVLYLIISQSYRAFIYWAHWCLH